ncbi:flagellar biosynthesis protein FlhB [Uliginosibacterium sp. H1]|uniref:flagellar biosynthesis protein FlhB n=1 Tax=Uliginosibacterium sp. H1 TaxID=3114757 RepID=UPI002E198570|nr:flagellar biosynthesis protein FlhB [Uliginosibacterium sp. H1]
MAEENDEDKTEPASERRLQQAREEGNVPQSRELATFLVMMGGVLGLWVSWRWMLDHLNGVLRSGLSVERETIFAERGMLDMLSSISSEALLSLAPLFAVLVIAAIAAPVMLGGLLFSSKAVTPDLNRVNPLSGIKRVFSLHGLAELVKGLLKSVLVGGVGAWVLWHYRYELLGLSTMSLETASAETGRILLWATLSLASCLAVLALVDVPFQLWRYYSQLKMSKQELKQEMKEQDGDPQIKAQIRARQREMARRRMMESVPKADVVVTNPTHFAVALKYDSARMGAPTIVAKGADLVAHNIRELARKHGVPLLEAPPLARALFRHAEVGQQVPAALYTAVAEVMAYVYQLNHFLSAGGLPPDEPHDIAIPVGMDPGSASSAAQPA